MSDHRIRQLESLADWMDSKFTLPGTKIKFGLDSLVGLIPGIGDTATLLVSAHIYRHAHSYNLPGHVKLRMLWNIFIDWLIGLIPVVGDLFDIKWKANRRNIELLKKHIK